MKGEAGLVGSGFALVAACYGLARFAYGLFLPVIGADLGLDQTLAGLIGAGAFAAYCAAVCAASVLCDRLGPRAVATAAGAVATAGMALIASARSPSTLGVAVALAGLSTGLASPPLAAAVSAAVGPARQGAANTIVNSGTGAGVILSGPAALLLGDAWRDAYAAFCAISLGVTVWVWRAMPARGGGGGPVVLLPALTAPELRPALAAAFLAGAASMAVWTFGGRLLHDLAGWDGARVGLAWIVIGAAGLAGAAAGALVRAFGLNAVHRLSLAAMAASFLMLASLAGTAPWAFLAAALFGGAYIMVTGVLLVWGVEAVPSHPALGLGAPFLSLAVGQVAGAPAFGALYDALGAPAALVASSAVCLGATAFGRAGRAAPSPGDAGKVRGATRRDGRPPGEAV